MKPQNFWDYCKKVAKLLAENHSKNYASRMVISDMPAVTACFDTGQTSFDCALLLARRKEKLPKIYKNANA